MPLEEFLVADPSLDGKVYEVLGTKKSVAAFASYGSTAPAEVANQIVRWKEKLST